MSQEGIAASSKTAVPNAVVSEENRDPNSKMCNEDYTLIRVKRKTTDDPEQALTVNSKKVYCYIIF